MALVTNSRLRYDSFTYFMDLPQEIRLNIYEEFFKMTNINLHDEFELTQIETPHSEFCHGFTPIADLLLVNKTIYAEAQPMIFMYSTVIVEGGTEEDVSGVDWRETCIPLHILKKFQHIYVSLDDCRDFEIEPCPNLMSRFLEVKTMHLDVCYLPAKPYGDLSEGEIQILNTRLHILDPMLHGLNSERPGFGTSMYVNNSKTSGSSSERPGLDKFSIEYFEDFRRMLRRKRNLKMSFSLKFGAPSTEHRKSTHFLRVKVDYDSSIEICGRAHDCTEADIRRMIETYLGLDMHKISMAKHVVKFSEPPSLDTFAVVNEAHEE